MRSYRRPTCFIEELQGMIMEFEDVTEVQLERLPHVRIFVEQGLILEERRQSLANFLVGIQKSIK